MSNLYVNLVHWNALNPKKAILPTFQDKQHIFSVKITKPELTTYIIINLGYYGHFESKGGGPTYKKVAQ